MHNVCTTSRKAWVKTAVLCTMFVFDNGAVHKVGGLYTRSTRIVRNFVRSYFDHLTVAGEALYPKSTAIIIETTSLKKGI